MWPIKLPREFLRRRLIDGIVPDFEAVKFWLQLLRYLPSKIVILPFKTFKIQIYK